jgi:CRISPR-associated protein Csd1
MLVHALAAYADTYLQDALADPAFEEKPVPFAVVLDDVGRFLTIEERTMTVPRGKKVVTVPQPLSVPRSPINRNSTVAPLLGCDGVQYVLGPRPGAWTDADDAAQRENHAERHEAFAALVRRVAAETNDPALAACAAFYADASAVERAAAALAAARPAGGALVALAVRPSDPLAADVGGPVVTRGAVREWWRSHYAAAYARRVAGAGEGMCLISGTVGPIAPTHNPIKGTVAIGGQASGVALMSFDKPAFQSYGWEQNANAPVSPERAAAYVLALNDLLQPGAHRRGTTPGRTVPTRFDAGGTAFLFWTREPSDDDMLALVNEPQPEAVRALFQAPAHGDATAVRADDNEFYLVAVSGNGARLQVRDWFHDSLARVRRRVCAWFEALRVPDVLGGRGTAPPPPLWRLRAAISPLPSDKDLAKRLDAVPNERTVQLLRRALQGVPLGHAMLAAALDRMRAAQGAARLDAARVALIRLCVNDLSDRIPGAVPMPETFDSSLQDAAYICGALLAVYENLQYQAHRDPEDPKKQVNVTVVDRYWALASTQPNIAFRQIRELGFAHLRKLRRGTKGDDGRGYGVYRAFEKELAELHDRLAALGGFPRLLSLEAQGRFALGYYQRKAEAQRRIAEAKARKGDEATDPSTNAA